MSEKKTVHIFANLVLLIMTVSLALFTFGGEDAVSSVNAGPHYRAEGAEGKVSLMINVYWGTEYIDGMLDVLDEYGARCTFFIGGSWARGNSELLNKIVARGHEIGNHGYSHLDHARLGREAGIREIKKAEKVIYETCKVKTTLFAPPSGAVNETVVSSAREIGYETVMWTRDTIDWRDKDAQKVIKRAVNGLTSGDFVLMHPTAHTLEALPSILAEIKEKNLTAVTVSECLGKI